MSRLERDDAEGVFTARVSVVVGPSFGRCEIHDLALSDRRHVWSNGLDAVGLVHHDLFEHIDPVDVSGFGLWLGGNNDTVVSLRDARQ